MSILILCIAVAIYWSPPIPPLGRTLVWRLFPRISWRRGSCWRGVFRSYSRNRGNWVETVLDASVTETGLLFYFGFILYYSCMLGAFCYKVSGFLWMWWLWIPAKLLSHLSELLKKGILFPLLAVCEFRSVYWLHWICWLCINSLIACWFCGGVDCYGFYGCYSCTRGASSFASKSSFRTLDASIKPRPYALFHLEWFWLSVSFSFTWFLVMFWRVSDCNGVLVYLMFKIVNWIYKVNREKFGKLFR